jgi:hypothetical protein
MIEFDENTDLIEACEELQERIFALEELMRFYHHAKIPSKYRKAFPKDGESLFFTAGPFKKTIPEVRQVTERSVHEPTPLDLPKDPVIYKAQIAKMNSWQTGENAKRIAEINKEAKENAKIIAEIEKNKKT